MDYSGKIITKNPVEPSQTSAPGVWTLDQATQAVQGNNWPIAYVPNPISRSLRFNSADSAYLSRTPASAGNRKTWTYSVWLKRSDLTTGDQAIIAANTDANNRLFFYFQPSGTIEFYHNIGGTTYSLATSAVYRDPSAWYNFVISVDTTQATSSNRLKFYVNGVQQTLSGSYVPQNTDTQWNAAIAHYIGKKDTSSVFYSGYYTEIHSIDGSALDPTYFGMTDPRTGAWIPKKYSGTYGTNGFYLNFSNNASTAALGTDYSGNSNTWTTNNFSVTAGSGNDSMTDVPTPWIPYNTTGDVGGVVRGNYATLNPLQSAGTLANGNLDWTGPTANGISISTMGSSSGKWYWECNLGSTSNKGTIGVVRDPQQADINTDGYSGNIAGRGYALDCETSPPKIKFNGTASDYGTQPTSTSDVLMVAIDLTNSSIFFGLNGTWFNSSNPATNTSPAFSSITAGTYFPFVGDQWGSASSSWVINFGQRPFAYTPPAGFKSLCTTNLPEPTVLDGGDYFNAVLYTGNNQTLQSITTVGFQPDLIWIKNRNASNHVLVDSVRGRGFHLASNLSNAEATDSSTQGVTAFLSNGFSVEADPASYGSVNDGTNPYVAWNWKESATSGFDIVTYTGDGVAGRTVSHNLGVAPSMIICKNRVSASNWRTYHASLGATQAVVLDGTGAAQTQTYFWNDTAPTSSVFSVGTNADVNENGAAIVAYLFAAVPGFSAFGSYTGNGSTDGVFIYLGFRPKWIVFKASSTAGESWTLLDSVRDTYNVDDAQLYPNLSNAEANDGNGVDFLSNGVKIRSAIGNWNSNGVTYIYAAFAENPFKYSNAR